MEQRYAMSQGLGVLLVKENGPRILVSAERPDDGSGLYKAFFWGNGGRILLGTMAPEEGRLKIRRTFSREELRRQNVWPIQGGSAELFFSFQAPPSGWSWTEGGGLSLSEGSLRREAARLGRVLSRRKEEKLTLAYPFLPGKEFPFSELFCFARMAELSGRTYVLFSFDGKGVPTF